MKQELIETIYSSMVNGQRRQAASQIKESGELLSDIFKGYLSFLSELYGEDGHAIAVYYSNLADAYFRSIERQ